MEFAYVHANYGVKVTIMEFLDRVLPNEDEDVSKELAKHYKKLRRRRSAPPPGSTRSRTSAPRVSSSR